MVDLTVRSTISKLSASRVSPNQFAENVRVPARGTPASSYVSERQVVRQSLCQDSLRNGCVASRSVVSSGVKSRTVALQPRDQVAEFSLSPKSMLKSVFEVLKRTASATKSARMIWRFAKLGSTPKTTRNTVEPEVSLQFSPAYHVFQHAGSVRSRMN